MIRQRRWVQSLKVRFGWQAPDSQRSRSRTDPARIRHPPALKPRCRTRWILSAAPVPATAADYPSPGRIVHGSVLHLGCSTQLGPGGHPLLPQRCDYAFDLGRVLVGGIARVGAHSSAHRLASLL
jgi:hypothetical protein